MGMRGGVILAKRIRFLLKERKKRALVNAIIGKKALKVKQKRGYWEGEVQGLKTRGKGEGNMKGEFKLPNIGKKKPNEKDSLEGVY